ncbi:MAG: S8 family peptidase [Deltaproteobacteria bacterium]|jgi:hypothetical protein|nr:S8 family peptidase [Deltaproteobacteria bacterium]
MFERCFRGKAQNFTETLSPVDPAKGYEIWETRMRLTEEVTAIWRAANALDPIYIPQKLTTFEVIPHPDLLTRAYFPRDFLGELGFTVLGSRELIHAPRERFFAAPGLKGKGEARESADSDRTYALMVAASLDRLQAAPFNIIKMDRESLAAQQARYLEAIVPVDPASRLLARGTNARGWVEVTLFRRPEGGELFPLGEFLAFSRKLGFSDEPKYVYPTRGLIFLPVRGPRELLPELARFAFVREIQDPVALRSFKPPLTSPAPEGEPPCQVAPLESSGGWVPKTAVLDGGVPADNVMGPWLRTIKKEKPENAPSPGVDAHANGVAFAATFGPLRPGESLLRGWGPIDAVRVVDAASDQDNIALMYTALNEVILALQEGEYILASLSLGPDAPARDDKIHAWTAKIDQLLFERKILLIVAVGNNGGESHVTGAARVQSPSDSLNALSVGACDSLGPDWKRADYSAIGPGHGGPGLIKPDLVCFGGVEGNYFSFLGPGWSRVDDVGTSFAAPYCLRTAMGAWMKIGSWLSAVALKAILIHYAERGDRDPNEVGWGRLQPFNPGDEPVGANPNIFQGEMKYRRYVLNEIPLPEGDLTGKTLTIKATICAFAPVARYHPYAYALAAVEIRFIPDKNAPRDSKGHHPTLPFFDGDAGKAQEGQSPRDYRHSNAKTAVNSFPAEVVKAPCFLIRHVDRSESTEEPFPVDYGLAVTVTVT